jgi:carbon-monoxide dehydrogenase small subunit
MKRLLDVLREDLHLTGTKEGCGEGECGACSVILDDRLVNSCLVPVMQAAGSHICTIEESDDGQKQRLQQAFIQAGAAQCGICTPGMIMASLQLLSKNPHPSVDQIREGLAGNLCRCTGYMRIFEAVQLVAQQTE